MWRGAEARHAHEAGLGGIGCARIGARPRASPLCPSYKAFGCTEPILYSFPQLARVARIFKDICALAAHTDKAVAAAGSPPPLTSAPGTTSMVSSQEAALKAWALGLPMHLQFNEGNLSSAVEKISGRSSGGSNLGGERGSGFAALHTAAEVTMFFHIQTLRSAPGTDTKQKEFLASRQSQAVENIAFVLNAIGSRGRRNPSSELLRSGFPSLCFD